MMAGRTKMSASFGLILVAAAIPPIGLVFSRFAHDVWGWDRIVLAVPISAGTIALAAWALLLRRKSGKDRDGRSLDG